MIQIGVVGLGFGERGHVPAFRRTGRFEVCAVAAKTPGKAADAARRLGIPVAYDRWSDLIEDAAVQAVCIATPPANQVEIALFAIRHGKPVFLEKPVATDAEGAARLMSAAKSSGVPVMIDFEFCELDAWKKAKSYLEQGKIGGLARIAVSWHLETYANRHGIDSWKLYTAQGGGALQQFGSHVLHYLEWFAGKITALSCELRGKRLVNGCDASALLNIDHQSGVSDTVSLITDAVQAGGHRVEFFGTNGTMVLENVSNDTVDGFEFRIHSHASAEPEVFRYATSPGNAERQDGRIAVVSRIAERFANWIENGVPAIPSIEEGWRVQHLLDTAIRSAQEGGRRIDGLHGDNT